jgi:predicted dehydrogenase
MLTGKIQVLPSRRIMSMPNPNIALVGCGGWGRNWMRELLAQRCLKAICDPQWEGKNLSLPSGIACFDSLDTLLSQENIHALVIATPAETHKDIALRALAAGKHILVEKPLATSQKDARAILKAAEHTRLVGMVGHLMLYHPAITWIKKHIDQGEIGELYYMTARRLNLGKIRQSEDAVWSFAPHDLSVALHFFKETPEDVIASSFCFLQKKKNIADLGFLYLEFPSGKIFHGHFSWLDPAKRREMVFVGSKKMIVFEDAQPINKIQVFDKGAVTVEEGHPVIDEGRGPVTFSGDIFIPSLPSEPPLRCELKAFIAAIRGDATANLSPLQQGCDVIDILEQYSKVSRP